MGVIGQSALIQFVPHHDAFVGLDSDGCVFPTMELKQKQCFHAEIISHWQLEKIERPLRDCAEFVNLYSRWRGQNRFPALLMTFELLAVRADVRASGVKLPDTAALKNFIASGLSLSNAALEKEVDRTGDGELVRLLLWSLAVNANVERLVKNIAPFRGVRECLEKIRASADLIVVSQTPEEVLVREWQTSGLAPFPALIAGQELGTKTEHLQLAAGKKYAADRVLMIGDAFGDLHAARAAGTLFFPINPGHEEKSWQRLHDEAFKIFLAGAYAGAYEAALIAEFESLLPEFPPWKK
ncbi:MAG: HAD hydrolase-like protein [Kiritimatiellaeota bacterium]|nr:HAD hydrolase-like protein [Kiritimatiellota bacterium]